jgi:hypothetical protein
LRNPGALHLLGWSRLIVRITSTVIPHTIRILVSDRADVNLLFGRESHFMCREIS